MATNFMTKVFSVPCPNRRSGPSGSYPCSRISQLAYDSWMKPLRDPLGVRQTPSQIRAGADRRGRARLRSTRARIQAAERAAPRPGTSALEQGRSGFRRAGARGYAGPSSEEYAGIIVEALRGDHPESRMTFWRNHLVDAATRLDPNVAARLLAAAMEPQSHPYERSNLAWTLASVAERLEPLEAARICGQAARTLVVALEREKDLNKDQALSETLWRLSARLEPADAAQMLTTALGHRQEGRVYERLVESLLTISARLEPAHASRACGQAAQILADALARETDAQTCNSLARALASVSERLEPPEAARLCGQAAHTRVAALEREKDPNGHTWLAMAVQSLASRMELGQAKQICGQATRLLIPSLERIPATNTFYPGETPWLSDLSNWMDPTEAASLLAAAIERAQNAEVRSLLVSSLACAADRLDTAESRKIRGQVARHLITTLERETNVDSQPLLAGGILTLMVGIDNTEASQMCGQGAQILVVAFARGGCPCPLLPGKRSCHGVNSVRARRECTRLRSGR